MLWLRSLAALLLVPGTVVVLVPALIVRHQSAVGSPGFSFPGLAAGLMIFAGTALLLACVWQFFRHGRGTLAPIDPPRRLVVSGLYRFTRNPMYSAVALVLAGEALLFRSASLLAWLAAFVTVVHLFVVLYEEPALTRRFGACYEDYRQAVPRWGIARRPYEASPAEPVSNGR